MITDFKPADDAASHGLAGQDATRKTLQVAKRDGRLVDWDELTVESAVEGAFKDTRKKNGGVVTVEDKRLIHEIAVVVESKVQGQYADAGRVGIEEIQNIVEQTLLEDFHLEEIFDAYSEYRIKRMKERAKAADPNEAIKRFLRRDKNITNENANKDSRVYSTQRDLLAGAIAKATALKMLPRDVANAHTKGDIHYHDLDYSPFTAETNCSLPNFKDMLANGFMLGNAPMKHPRSIGVAATQTTQIMQDVASSQYGGQTFDRMDETLAEYARYDYDKFMEEARETMPDDLPIDFARRQVEDAKKNEAAKLHFDDDGREPLPMDEPFDKDASPIEQCRQSWAKIKTRKAIYDAIQTLEHQINSNRVASTGQTPFTTIGIGLGTDWFSREIQRCVFLIRIRGLGKDHRTAIFPKITFALKHGVNMDPGDPNYDIKQLALECATKRMYPDCLYYDNIVRVTGSFKSPMGCRSFLQAWTNPETGEDEESGRMNLGVVSLNLPRIALESKGDVKRFWRIFEQRMEVMHHALQFRIKRCKEAQPEAAPSLWQYGAFGRLKPGESVDKLMKNNRATVSAGYIGLFETTAMFYGTSWVNNSGWDTAAYDFAMSILKRMTELCKQWEAEEGYHYSVYGTPSENLCYRFNMLDKAKFGVVKGITDRDYYTNSFHINPELKLDHSYEPKPGEEDVRERPTWHDEPLTGPFFKYKFEAPFMEWSAGGMISYVEEPMLTKNTKALEAIWDYADKVGITFGAVNQPIDHCLECDYRGDFQPSEDGYKCPNCGNTDEATIDVTKRVCGYLGNPGSRGFNRGKQDECAHRTKHSDGETGRVVTNGALKEFYADRSMKSRLA